jgi:hypothetical protein
LTAVSREGAIRPAGSRAMRLVRTTPRGCPVSNGAR